MSPAKRRKRAWRTMARASVSPKVRRIGAKRYNRAMKEGFRVGCFSPAFDHVGAEVRRIKHDRQHPTDFSHGTLAFEEFKELLGYVVTP